jgi:hypothetical protein
MVYLLRETMDKFMNNTSFSPVQKFHHAIRYWWIVIVGVLAGSLLGYCAHFFQKPVYEAKAAISTSIDFSRTGEMTDIEEDVAITMVGDLIKSTQTFEAVVDQANERGILLDMPSVERNSYYERQNFRWLLRVRWQDPAEAARIVNIWARISFDSLLEANSHAIQADQLSKYADSLTGCLEHTALTEPFQAVCDPGNAYRVQTELSRVSEQVAFEKEASLGILPAMTFNLSEEAQPPSKAVLFHSGAFILAGALLGSILGVFLVENLPGQWITRKNYVD